MKGKFDFICESCLRDVLRDVVMKKGHKVNCLAFGCDRGIHQVCNRKEVLEQILKVAMMGYKNRKKPNEQ